MKQSQPYLEYLLDRAAAGHNLNTDEGRVKFLAEMLPIAARIPDATMRDRFADRLAHKARVTDGGRAGRDPAGGGPAADHPPQDANCPRLSGRSPRRKKG